MYPTSARSPDGLIEASVIVQGVPQPLYRRLDGRWFVAGVPRQRYTLTVRNLSAGRVEVVSSVDGRNTLRQEPADLHACRGAIIYPGSERTFTGWRLNDSETAEFLFGDPGASNVAAQATSSLANVGVIGFAVYREHTLSTYTATYDAIPGGSAGHSGPMPRVVSLASAAPVATAAAPGAAGPSLGTDMGQSHHDPVSYTDFARTGSADVLAIGYHTEAVLRERGILVPLDPDPFPGIGTGYEQFTRR